MMSRVNFSPASILIIDFGQLGDVVMSLPALRAVREHFPRARITVAVGKPGADVINISGYADALIVIDRVSLRDGFKPLSIWRVLQIVKDVRRRQFDFVIDLHSFSETNLLGFLSGAPMRLFSRRPGRSLDFLASFDPQPPIDRNDPKVHLTDRYLGVLAPLGIRQAERKPRLVSRPTDDREIERLLRITNGNFGRPLVGLNPGAGHKGRRWPLEKFVELADCLVRNDDVRIVVFAGPEEVDLLPQLRRAFPAPALILHNLTIGKLLAAQARLSVFVSNDTGPVHLAAAVGVPLVLLSQPRAPETYVPLNEPKRIIRHCELPDITVEEAYAATRELLVAGRTESLFAV
jgi:heptosyltransferase-2